MKNPGKQVHQTQDTQVKISGSLLARNALINLIGQAAPLLVGVMAIPFVVRGLGTERFGLLSLAWVIMGYFTLFDLGLGRATTKYVAEALGKGNEDQVPKIVWTAVTFQAILGLVGALILFGITDILVERVLNIPIELVGEAKDTFHLLAFSIPVVLVSSSFSGVLEAAQRFDLVNAVKIPTSTLTYILPLVGLSLGLGLPGIVALILLARLGALIAFVVMDLDTIPKLRGYSISFNRFSLLFAYGGWITVTSIIGPILIYLDRFMIGSFLTIAAVTYYTAPYEAVTRLSVVSTSLTSTLFPAFSTLEGINDRQKLSTLFARSVKYILLALGPIIVIIGLFAKEILHIWLGVDFVIESTLALQILAIGVLINSLTQTPFALLQGIGRPDLPAKFHLIELPVYIGMAWILVNEFGIAGAAGAWTLRVALDALLLFVATFKKYQLSPSLFVENGITHATFELVMLAGIAYSLKAFAYALPLSVQSLLVIGFFVSFIFFAWKYVLDDSDRGMVLKLAKLRKIRENIS